jgi:hypothetical protein
MEKSPPIDELLQRLTTRAQAIHDALSGREIDWTWRPGESDWSLVEVVCHLRDVEQEVHQWRFREIAGKENAFIPGVSADEWASERRYRQQDGPAALQTFFLARSETIRLLRSFSPEMWERQGRHAFLGPTSMHEMLHISERHDALHWKQIQELLSAKAKSGSGLGDQHSVPE